MNFPLIIMVSHVGEELCPLILWGYSGYFEEIEGAERKEEDDREGK